MRRSQRIHTIKGVTQFKENEVAKKLAMLMRGKQENEERLKELIRYEKEYAGGSMTESISIKRLQANRAFLEQLSVAINSQRQRVEILKIQVNEQVQHWRVARGKTRALDELIGRYRIEEQKKINQREQRALDENSQLINKNTPIMDKFSG